MPPGWAVRAGAPEDAAERRDAGPGQSVSGPLGARVGGQGPGTGPGRGVVRAPSKPVPGQTCRRLWRVMECALHDPCPNALNTCGRSGSVPIHGAHRADAVGLWDWGRRGRRALHPRRTPLP